MNAAAEHNENELPNTKAAARTEELRRDLSPQSVLGECDFPSHMKKLTLLGNVLRTESLASIQVTLLGQVSP